jgi:hypothetical protein
LKKTVLLTFDIEEFDMPLEYGASLPLHRQLEVSSRGTSLLLDILAAHNIKATFFSTVVFAENNLPLIQQVITNGHELASHSYFHSRFENADLGKSKRALENLSQSTIQGFRMPRMMPVDGDDLAAAGYIYNSSINPVWVPGRYNNLHSTRTVYRQNELIQVPASATPLIRFPLFWLSFHLIPLWIFKEGCRLTMNTDGYLNLYFHPWEFVDLSSREFGLPKYIVYNTGERMVKKFTALVKWMNSNMYEFQTMSAYLSHRFALAQLKNKI